MAGRDAFGRTALAAAAWLAAAAARGDRAHPDGLVGTYDGGQLEIAASLELRADGRFRYGLSYGALDEAAGGSWIVENGAVLLTGDPVKPPRLVLLGQATAATGTLSVDLEVPPGLSRQYFVVELTDASGSGTEHQLSEEPGPEDIPLEVRVASVALTLPILDLRSDVVPLSDAAGTALRFRFEPNDLGKVAFAREPLRIDGSDLLLAHADRTIRFRRLR